MKRLAVPLVILALGLTGCTGGGDDGAGANPAPSAADQQEQMRAFAKCMRANGVDMPDPNGDNVAGMPAMKAGSPELKKVEAATEKCRDLLPAATGEEKISKEDLENARALSKCMRENGMPDFPDPDPETGAVALSEKTIDADRMSAAGKKCQGAGGPAIRLGQAG